MRVWLFIVALAFPFLCISQSLKSDWAKLKEAYENNTLINTTEFDKLISRYEKSEAADADVWTQLYFYYGDLFMGKNDLEKASEKLSRAYTYSQKAKDTTLKYVVILSFARISFALEDHEKAEEYYRYALPGISAMYGQSSLDYTIIFYEYVRNLVSMRRYAEATPMLEALNYYFKTLNLIEHPSYLSILANQAWIKKEEGDANGAIQLYSQLVSNDLLLKQGDTSAYVTILTNMADIYRETDQSEKALAAIRELKNQMNLLGYKDPDQVGFTENILGLIYKNLGNYQESEKAFNSAIQIYINAKLTETSHYCTVLSNYSDLLRYLGRREEAMKMLETSMVIRKKKFGVQTETYANSLTNYALLLQEKGEDEKAKEYFEDAFKIYALTVSKNSVTYANALNNLSYSCLLTNDLENAARYKNEALELMDKNYGKQNYRYISFLNGAVMIDLAKGNTNAAMDKALTSMQLAQAKYGRSHMLYTNALSNLADVYLIDHNYVSCLRTMTELMDLKMQELSSYFYSMNYEDQASYLQEIQMHLDGYATVLMNLKLLKDPSANDSVLTTFFNYQLQIRSLLNRNVSAMNQQLLTIKDETLKQEYEKLQSMKRAMLEMLKEENGSEDLSVMESSIKKQENLVRSKLKFTTEFHSNYGTVQKALSANEAAIEIYKYMDISSGNKPYTRYAALVVTKDQKTPRFVQLSPANLNDTLCLQQYLQMMDSEQTDTLSYNRFFAAIEHELKGKTKLYIAPSGIYHQLNLLTLYDPVKKNYVIDSYDIVQTNNLSSIEHLPESGDGTKRAALFGDPDFYLKDGRSTNTKQVSKDLLAMRLGMETISELPGTAKEVEMIGNAMSKNGWETEAYVRGKASEDNLSKIGSPRVLHIATHGYFVKESSAEEGYMLGFSTKQFARREELRSGLIMAGAALPDNGKDRGVAKDGIFTSAEATLLNLSNTDLVVLSACQTALGFEKNNQGVAGLQQAFGNAGAKNMIISLWPVDDKATQLLMAKFYEEYLKDPSLNALPDAFKKAQQSLRKEYEHPYFWGAFILQRN